MNRKVIFGILLFILGAYNLPGVAAGQTSVIDAGTFSNSKCIGVMDWNCNPLMETVFIHSMQGSYQMAAPMQVAPKKNPPKKRLFRLRP